MPVLLLTDALIYLLLALAVGFGIYASRHEHLRAPWRRVLRSRVGMASLVVLGFYVVIGLLDTLHFHPADEKADAAETVYSPKILSLLEPYL